MRRRMVFVLAVLLFGAGSPAWAQDGSDKDNYRWRVEGDWWFIHPQGDFGARDSNNYINFNEDFHFGDYSTFTGKVDWRFHRKHHLLFNASPVGFSKTAIINRTITFQGQTFDVGTQVQLKMRAYNFAPGYQYDIVRRNWGYVGVQVIFNLLDTSATLNSTTTVNGQTVAKSASRSVLAPLPSFGPVFRVYPLPHSDRLDLDGAVTGMYFFGYGSFLASRASLGIRITHGLVIRGGYQLGSRLSIHGASNQIGLRMTTSGPTAGLEYSWGKFPEKEPHEHVPAGPSNWHVDWIPLYLWFSGLHGFVGAGGYVVPVNQTFSDVFSQLNFAYMTALDVRNQRRGVLTDFIFMSLSSNEKATPIGAFGGYSTNNRAVFIDPEIYGRVVNTKRFSADALAGTRVWHLNNGIDFYQGGTATITAGQTQGWVDAVLGARFRMNFDKGWFATVKGDDGPFETGSQQTYQVYGSIAKECKEKYSFGVGWRYLLVDYKNGGFLYDTHMNGPIVGFNVRFK